MNKNILFMAILGSFVLLQDIGAAKAKGLTAKAASLVPKAPSLASLKEGAKSVTQNLVQSVPSNFI